MDLVDALVLRELKGVGDDTLARLLGFSTSSQIHSLEEIAQIDPTTLPLKRVPTCLLEFLASGNFESARTLQRDRIQICRQQGVEVIHKEMTTYPVQLLGLDKVPPFLFCKGNMALLHEKAIAVVGTRENTPKGELITVKTVEEFSKSGFTIVSGLALGIDTLAHQSAIKFNAPTISVLVDLESVSPKANRKLSEDILDRGGLLVSENPPGTRTIPAFFAKRDRIQAGLSTAVFAMETSINGGTMHAVKAADSMSRPIYVPNPKAAGYLDLSLSAIEGTQHLIKTGIAEPYTRQDYESIKVKLADIYSSFGDPVHGGRLL